MSDIDQETVEVIHLGEEVTKFMNSALGKYLINYAEQEAESALDKLSVADPTDSATIMRLQSDINRSRKFKAWLEEALQAAELAYQQYLESLN
jgi:hypothetical protein